MSEVSAKAGQFVVVTYHDDLPSRLVVLPSEMDKYNKTTWLREVTMPTDHAVDLYNQLRSALYD